VPAGGIASCHKDRNLLHENEIARLVTDRGVPPRSSVLVLHRRGLVGIGVAKSCLQRIVRRSVGSKPYALREEVPQVFKQRQERAIGKKLALGLLAGVLAITLGCSADDIMGPGSATMAGGGSGDGSAVVILADPQGRPVEPGQGEASNGAASVFVKAAEGGVVSCGRFTVVIPAGALAEDTEITISRPDPMLVMCELGPHGLQFEKPVTLRIDYSGTAAEDAESELSNFGVYWFNEDAGRWELVGKEIDPGSDVVQAQLLHFSDYGSGHLTKVGG